MLERLRYTLNIYLQKQKANQYMFDGEVKFRNASLAYWYDKEIDRLRAEIELYEQFEGDPMEWKANGDSISECQECPHNEKCKRWNDYINRPARKRFDANGDVIEYDKTGNLKYQVLNLKTGEQI